MAWAGMLLLTLIVSQVRAAPAEIFVVDGGSNIHARILDAARSELEANGSDVVLRRVPGATLSETLTESERPALVVTLGTRAAQALDGPLPVPVPVLHAAISRTLYEELTASDEPHSHPLGHSALFLDQPTVRQIGALKAALPQLQRIGLLASVGRETLIEPLARAASDAGIEVVDAIVPEDGLLIPRVEQLLRYADALLITPDPALYNRYTLQKVLLAAYRQRKPVIGLSGAYVKAGALFAVHSNPAAIGKDLGIRIARFVASDRLDPPGYPEHYSIAVNRHVARSLGLNLPSEKALLEVLRERETRP